jgi:hypothetical protein
MNATGAPTLQESLERINEENVASSGGAVGNPKAEGQGQMTWDDTTTTADAQDTQALWRSFMHSGGGGPQQDGTIAASQPVHQGAQAGNTGASTSNAVVQSTSIQDAGANAVNGKEEESSAAQGVAARVLAQAAAAASSPIGMNAAISRQGTGRPLEAISEAKTLLSDLVSGASCRWGMVRAWCLIGVAAECQPQLGIRGSILRVPRPLPPNVL